MKLSAGVIYGMKLTRTMVVEVALTCRLGTVP